MLDIPVVVLLDCFKNCLISPSIDVCWVIYVAGSLECCHPSFISSCILLLCCLKGQSPLTIPQIIMSQDTLRVLIVGSGGREHAFAWKLSQSPLVETVYVATGNGGTAEGRLPKISNANVKADDYPGLVKFAQEKGVNLVVPGPEAPLVDGIQGYFQAGKPLISLSLALTNAW